MEGPPEVVVGGLAASSNGAASSSDAPASSTATASFKLLGQRTASVIKHCYKRLHDPLKQNPAPDDSKVDVPSPAAEPVRFGFAPGIPRGVGQEN